MAQPIIESYLALLCETCGADGVHLTVAVAGAEERPTLVDRHYRPSLRYDASPIPEAHQMAFALVSEVAAAHPLRETETRGAEPSNPLAGPSNPAAHPTSPVPWHVSGSDWNLAHRIETQEWCFRGMLRGMDVEMRLALRGGEILRRLDTVWPFLAFLGHLLAETDLGSAPPGVETETTACFDPPLVGVSAAALDLRRRVRSLADATIPVLIEGESGTGKEIIARNLHRLGGRNQRPLVIVNCMELPETLLQSELFGYLKGAFTGAVRDRMGLVESASGGTLFLDEIGEMPLAQQAALLRVLQEREVRRIGDSARRKVDVRFVFATNRDLGDRVKRGQFREDLYFRVSAVRLSIPPLRRRREDIAPLAGHFLRQHAACGGSMTGISPAALCRMLSYRWPGNVRELKNEIERAVVLNGGARTITVDMLSPAIREAQRDVSEGVAPALESLRAAVDRLERRMIMEALEWNDGNRTRAAGVLGLSRQGLLKKMRRYGVGRP